MKTISGSVMVGKCPKCGTVWESQFLVKLVNGHGVIPPPVIRVGCNICSTQPPQQVDLFYFRPIDG